MKVLVVYAHPDPDSFTHAILEHVALGLADGGHDLTVNDLYAIGFDPVFTQHDGTQFLHESLPDELLERANLEEEVLRNGEGPDPSLHGQALASWQGPARHRQGDR